jgi:hypothetical protein
MDASSFHSSYKDLIYTQNATNLLPNDTEYARRESKLSLRFDWKNLTPTLDLTKHILQHQSNCSLPMATFAYRNRFGLGSDLHMYAQGICNALESNRRIRTVGDWAWMDQGHCQNHVMGSPMHCYFSQAELNCPGDASFAISNPQFDLYIENSTELLSKPNGNVPNHCPSFIGPNGKFNEHLMQIATVESLFIHVTPLLYQEATRQLNLVFGDLSRIPDDLVTVHIRWGDKVETYDGKRKRRPEMNKVDIHDYIVAVRQIIRQRRGNNQTAETANVFLATEDPAAVKAFRAAMPPGWKLYVDQFLTETQSHRVNEYNGASKMSKRLGGSAGLVALGSLLVAMEANDFVLTTESNWSRVMDSLRQAIVESRVNRRTNMVDLRKWKGVAKTEHTIM